MSDPASVMVRLDELAHGLDTLSKELWKTEADRALAQDAYDDFIDDYLAGLAERADQEGKRLPGDKDTRLSMAHRAMPPEVLGNYRKHTREAEKLRRRIADVKAQVDAQRSILSALKAELEASR